MNATYPSLVRSWQYPASRVVKGMRLVDVGVTVKDRILLHLLDYWGQMHRSEWPVELTQDGIAGVVGISRSHVAVTLPDLIEEDMVEVTTQRVVGRPRRVKVYALTYKGGNYAGQVVQQLLRTEVTASDETGEWELPLDGLIQVHKVHMLSALRLVDEENRIDLQKASALAEPAEGEEAPAEEAPVEATAAGTDEMAELETGPEAEAARQAAAEKALEEFTAEAVGPGVGAGGSVPVPIWTDRRQEIEAVGRRPPEAGPGAGAMPGYGYYTQRQAYYWSPLRFGTGRVPHASNVASMLVLGFVVLMTAVAFFGLSPGYCSVLWVPLGILGGALAWYGFRDLWALGPRREVWTAAAMSSYMSLGVTMVAFAAFGQEVVIDLLWASLVLGIPSLVLAAGSGRSVERRGSFMLLIGPVMVISALTLAVLDPGGMGRTDAMPLLVVTVGVAWALVGWMMVRPSEDLEGTRLVVAGGSIGLAIAALAGAGNLAADGRMNPVLGTAVVFWLAGAAYVVVIMLHPSLEEMRPDRRAMYVSLAVGGAGALVTAAVFFVWGGLLYVGIMEVVIAVGMVAMVAPELSDAGRAGRPLILLGLLMATTTVLAVSLGL
jgi:hypothetical protein